MANKKRIKLQAIIIIEWNVHNKEERKADEIIIDDAKLALAIFLRMFYFF